ncbi:DUF998 domain-containing protein [Streptomyces sp. NPDC054956]
MSELTVTAPRRLLAGGLLWASLVQIFIVNNAVVMPRASRQSLTDEIISALGVTRCARVEGIRFCSPWHEAANSAWVVGGVCLALGAILNAVLLPAGRRRTVTTGAFVLSGLALVSAGLNPYNLRLAPHLLSAGTCFIAGAVGVLLLGSEFRRMNRPYWGGTGIVCGVVSLVGTAITAVHPLPSFQGLFERASAWPSVLWIIGTGVLLARAAWRTSHHQDDRPGARTARGEEA